MKVSSLNEIDPIIIGLGTNYNTPPSIQKIFSVKSSVSLLCFMLDFKYFGLNFILFYEPFVSCFIYSYEYDPNALKLLTISLQGKKTKYKHFEPFDIASIHPNSKIDLIYKILH